MNKSKYLLKNTALLALGNFASKFISFILIPLYTNYLTTSEYGTIDLISVITTITIPIITLNIGEAVIRFLLDETYDKNTITLIGIVIILLSSFFGLLLLPLLNLYTVLNNYSILLYFYIVTFAFSQFFLYLLRGEEKLGAYSVGVIIQTLLVGILNILFIKVLKIGISGYLLAYIISNLIIIIYGFTLTDVINAIKKYFVDKKIVFEMLKYSVVLIPNSLMWWIMNSLDKIVVVSTLGTSYNGIYSISYKLPTLLSTIASIFNQAWSYSAIKEEKSKNSEKFTNNIFEMLCIIIISMSIYILAFLKPLMKIFVGKEFYSAWRYVPLLLVGFVFVTLSSFFATSYTVKKDSVGFLKTGMIGAILNLILNFILIKPFGLYGVSFATCISYIAVFIYRYVDTQKYCSINLLSKNFAFGIILLIFSVTIINCDNLISDIIVMINAILVLILYRKELIHFISRCLIIIKEWRCKSLE